MRNYRPYCIIVLLFLLTLVFSIPACVKLGNSQQASLVSDVALAGGVDSQSKPVDASNVFTVIAEVIYLSMKLTDAPNNTAVMAKLTYLGGEVSSMTNSTLYSNTQNAQGTRYLSFAMKPPPGGFPAGNYQVIVSANGKEQASVPFTVENLKTQKAGLVIKKFTVDHNTITAGKTVILSWEVSDATRVTLQPEIGIVAASGTRSITPTTTATYRLIASNDTGSVTSELTVNVGAALSGAPDLVITDLWLEGCMIYYKIKNTGTRDSTPTYTYLYVDDMFPPLGGTSFVDVLKPGQEKSMQFSSFQWPGCGTSGGEGPGEGGGLSVAQALFQDYKAKQAIYTNLQRAWKDNPTAEGKRLYEQAQASMLDTVQTITGTEVGSMYRTWLATDRKDQVLSRAVESEMRTSVQGILVLVKKTDKGESSQDKEPGSGASNEFSIINHTVKACADAKNELEEGDKNNNCTSKNWGMLMKYDLLQMAHLAIWLNNSGFAPYFGLESSPLGGYIKLGDGSLEVIPLKMPQGFTQGYFGYFSSGTRSLGEVDTGPTLVPSMPIKIPPKLKFFAKVGLSDSAQGSDGVTFKLGLKTSSGDTIFLPGKTMTQPGKFEDWIIDLSNYEGQVVRFVLRVEAGASPENDFAIWKEARLEQIE